MTQPFVFALLTLFASAELAHAIQCSAPLQMPGPRVERFTNYAPRAGGINGRCGTSASGYDACKFFLEDHLEGRSDAVMIAVPQRGGTSHLFGGIYQGVALENSLGTSGRCIRLFAGDRYATSSNNMSKADVCTRDQRSNVTQRINMASGEVRPLGRAPRLRRPQRRVQRNPAATAPVAYTGHQMRLLE